MTAKALILIFVASAAQAQDKPPRPTGVEITSLQSQQDLSVCIGRFLAKHGRVTTLPLQNGIVFDFHFGGGIFVQSTGKAHLSFSINDDESRKITVEYRHPLSRKTAINMLKDLGNRCFASELLTLTGE